MNDKIKALVDALNACEAEGYAIVTHAWGRLELAVEGEPGGSVFLVYPADRDGWVALGFNGRRLD